MARPNQDKINIVTHKKQKALTIVGAFCFLQHISQYLDVIYRKKAYASNEYAIRNCCMV